MTDFFERIAHAFFKFFCGCGVVGDFLLHRAHTRWYVRRMCHMPQCRDLRTGRSATCGWTFTHQGSCVRQGPLPRADVSFGAECEDCRTGTDSCPASASKEPVEKDRPTG